MQVTTETLGVKPLLALLIGAVVVMFCSVLGLAVIDGGGAATSPGPGGPSSVLGPPTISTVFINKVLAENHSPALGTGAAFYYYGLKYGIDPVFALAFFQHESSFGTKGVARVTKSISNTVCTSGTPANERYETNGHCFHKYANWTDSVEGWFRLIRLTYVDKWHKSTLEQIIPTYSPSSDGNNPSEYISSVEKSVANWRSGKV